MPYQRQPMQQMPQVQRFEVSGKVQGVSRGMIKLLSDKNQAWLIQISRRTQVSVQGQVTADFLRSGMLISASAELDKRGRVLSPVAQITILGQGSRAGVVPGIFLKQKQGGFDEPIGPGGGAGEKPVAKAGTMYDLVGVLGPGKKGRYVVNTGRNKAEFELAENALIDLDVTDYSLAQPGDKVTAVGLLGSDGRSLVAQAQSVTIELASRVEQSGMAPQGPALRHRGGSKTQAPGAVEGGQPKPADQPADAPTGPQLQAP